MKIRITVILGALILVSAGLALSQENAEPQVTAAPSPQESNESNTQWVWGEVVNVDSLAKTLTLKYLDYETDQEKELSLTVDDVTSYQNFKSLDDLGPKDNLSIDYIAKDGKNIAKSISLEKSESASAGNKTDAGVASLPEVAAAQKEMDTHLKNLPQVETAGTENSETDTQAPQANQ